MLGRNFYIHRPCFGEVKYNDLEHLLSLTLEIKPLVRLKIFYKPNVLVRKTGFFPNLAERRR